jgi:hypothetical protein
MVSSGRNTCFRILYPFGNRKVSDIAERKQLMKFITASPECRQLEYHPILLDVILNACRRTVCRVVR